MKIHKDRALWYFSSGFLAEHTEAVFLVSEQILELSRTKHLSKIIEYLQKNLTATEITVHWFKNEKPIK